MEVLRLMGAMRKEEEFHGGLGRAGSLEEPLHKRNFNPCSNQKLKLYCKKCTVPGCGKCVSDQHQGLFHSINLLEMVYEEEKLNFFSSLKKLREVHEKLIKEANDEERDIEDEVQS